MSEIVSAAEALIEAITIDNGLNGGLVSRETIRRADELRILLLKFRLSDKGAPK